MIYVTDFATGKHIDATRAVYIEGSDVNLCHQPEVMKSESGGCCAYSVYDRCSPSVIAFENTNDTRFFLEKHGGLIVKFDDLVRRI